MDWERLWLPPGFATLDEYSDQMISAYSKVSYLPELHITEFFVESHWQRLPPEWQQFLASDSLDIHQLIALASKGTVPKGSPSSLSQFINDMFSLRFPRDQVNLHASTEAQIQQTARIRKYFLDGMSEKKQAEVIELSRLVLEVAQANEADLIVDVGAGQGYLSRVLAYALPELGNRVLAVDFSDVQKKGAQKYQMRTIRRLRGTKARADGYVWREELNDALVHRVANVGMANAVVDLSCAAREVVGLRGNWMLCGLHACGDLSSSIISAFVRSDATSLVLVPCCYNGISEDRGDLSGFPLSDEFKGLRLGSNALKAACQATPRWETKTNETIDAFKRNYHRALLHYLMVKHGLVSRNDKIPVLGSLTSTELAESLYENKAELQELDNEDDTHFAQYTYAALKRLNVDWKPSGKECASCRRDNKAGFKRMSAIWTLRSLVGPLIEGILVVDRVLYLRKHCGDGNVGAFALFDSVVSPRNLVLVAQKKKER